VTPVRHAIAFAFLLLAAMFGAAAQPAGELRRIGYLDQGSADGNAAYVDALRQGLRERGWIEGRNIAIETRFAEGRTEQLPSLAATLVERKVDVIVTWSTPAALAAKRATATIPIVIGFAADPVGSKIVSSLSHPGGNITGWTHQGLELRAKYLELLKEVVPSAARIGVLWNPANQVHKPSLKVIEAAAERLQVRLELAGVQAPKDLEPTFAALAAKHVGGIVVFPDGMFVAQMPAILALAARYRLPAMYGIPEYPEAGGLMSYGADLAQMQREFGASFIDKILKGAKPGDLAVEQPTKFTLVLNLKAARDLGLTLPDSLRVLADHIIE
jgi:putative ABC transport system substrate-binding protein